MCSPIIEYCYFVKLTCIICAHFYSLENECGCLRYELDLGM